MLGSPIASSARSFSGKSEPPEFPLEMKSKFIDLSFKVIRPQTTTSQVGIIFQKEDRPVLNAVKSQAFDFAMESIVYLLRRKGSADVSTDTNITPQSVRQREIVCRPVPEPNSLGGKEILRHTGRGRTASEILDHPFRSATIGSTPAARRAGIADASSAATPSISAANRSMTGSQNLTPKS